MARKCSISGKQRQVGNRVSHAKNKTKHNFDINLQERKVFVPSLGKSIKLKVTTRELRTIDKIGVEKAFKKYGKSLKKLVN